MYSGANGTFDDEYIQYVLDTYSAMLIRLCYTYTKNSHDAEDIAQDTFVELIKRKPQFENIEHEKAWLIRTASNKCKNMLSSCRSRLNVPLEDDISVSDRSLDELRSSVLDAVMKLPEKYRIVIHLFYYCDMSIREIAAALRIAVPTVGTRLARARVLLKQNLGEDFLNE